jgi:anti-anti-sigma factor
LSDGDPGEHGVLRSSVHPADTEVVVVLEGDVDAARSQALEAVLRAAWNEHRRLVVVDASAVRFLDSNALHAILATRDAIVRYGAELRMRNPSPAVLRVMELTGTLHLLAE